MVVAHLQLGNSDFELPVVTGTEQERGLDVSKLLATTGCVTLDEGYANRKPLGPGRGKA